MVVIVFHARNPAQHFIKTERLDGDAMRFQNFLAITHCVKGGWTRADRSNAQVTEAIYDTTDRGEPREIFGELSRIGGLGVQCGDGVWNAVLPEGVTRRHLSAEAIEIGR